jgi:hypothetical protein
MIMRTLIFIFGMLFSVLAFSQETSKTGLYYCVQVVSTENPELLKPDYFVMMYDKPMVEEAVVKGKKYYRIIFIYESVDDQDSALHNWQFQWGKAFRVTRTKEQIEKMYLLFKDEKI